MIFLLLRSPGGGPTKTCRKTGLLQNARASRGQRHFFATVVLESSLLEAPSARKFRTGWGKKKVPGKAKMDQLEADLGQEGAKLVHNGAKMKRK